MASITKYKKKDGTYYEVVLSLSGRGADRLRVKKRGFKTKKAAQDWAALETARYNLRGTTSTGASPRSGRTDALTYNEVAAEWLEQYEATVRPSTYRKTEGLFKHHILPALGAKTISKITAPELQRFVTHMRDKLVNYGPIYDYTRKVFIYALEVGYITINPFDAVKKPRKKEKDIDNVKTKQWSKDELLTFLEACKDYSNPATYPFFRLLAFSGMRRGELAALEWGDIDFNAGTVSINKAVTVDAAGSMIVGSTKNKSSVRTMALDAETLQVLKDWSDFIRPVMRGQGFNDKLVFPNRYGKPTNFARPLKWLQTISKRAGVPAINLHGLRHTHCTLLIESGANIKAVQERLGHSSIDTTLQIYSHVNKGIDRAAVDGLAGYLL